MSLLFIAATPIATGPHHILSLYPLPHILVGVAIAGIWRLFRDSPGWLVWMARGTASAAVTLIVVSNLTLAGVFHSRLVSDGGRGYWSEAIYDLGEALQSEYPEKTVVLLDWGLDAPLAVLSQGGIKMNAAFWRILFEGNSGPWLNALIRDPGNVFVIRSDKFAFNQIIHDHFMEAYLRQQDLKVEERKFFQRDGEHLFSILSFDQR
jgi:hypothetical protein